MSNGDFGSLWNIDADTSDETLQSIFHLSSQTSRTEALSRMELQTLITELSASDSRRLLEVIDYKNFDENSFGEMFSANLQPCVIRNCCETDQWRATERWSSIEALSKWYGNVQIRVTEKKDPVTGSMKPLRIPLVNYLSYCAKDSGGADFPWYGFDDDLSEDRALLLEDFSTPRYFRDDCYDVSASARHVFPANRFFIVGGARTGTPMHVDPNATSAWNTLLTGHKRWVLFPPTPADPAAAKSRLTAMGLDGLDDYTRRLTPPCRWWREVYPLLAGARGDEAGMLECLQAPGDTIFVPAGWWHAALNLDPTVAVTANPLLPRSLPAVWPSLAAAGWPRPFLVDLARRCAARWPFLQHWCAGRESPGERV